MRVGERKSNLFPSFLPSILSPPPFALTRIRVNNSLEVVARASISPCIYSFLGIIKGAHPRTWTIISPCGLSRIYPLESPFPCLQYLRSLSPSSIFEGRREEDSEGGGRGQFSSSSALCCGPAGGGRRRRDGEGEHTCFLPSFILEDVEFAIGGPKKCSKKGKLKTRVSQFITAFEGR